MSRIAMRSATCLAALHFGIVAPLAAQSAAVEGRAPWRERVSLEVGSGILNPTAHSQLYTLLDRALAPGGRTLQPRLLYGIVHYAVTPQVAIVLRADAGSHTTRSVSVAQPTTPAPDLRQQTTLRIRAQSTLGAQFVAWRWHGRDSSSGSDRVRLTFGAGIGAVSYGLNQHGTFVDATRLIAYRADYRSSGIGPMTYAASTLEVPVRRGVALSGILRRQWGSARMSQDYATFDRLDFGGTTGTIGLVMKPWTMRRR